MTYRQCTQSVGFVDRREMLDKLMVEVEKAQEAFAALSQEDVDRIFTRGAVAATQARVRLAKLAVEEGGMGVMEDKIVKNHVAAESVHNRYKDMKTCGIVERDPVGGIMKVAEPVGILAGVVPCTNPTSTTIFKCLLALKTRNCIVFSPHPRTAQCTIEAGRVIRDAAVAAGAPAYCISWLDGPTVELCVELMRHPKVSMIVATGAGGLVRSAYSSGKPAMGGGSGNTPVVIDETADIAMAVNSILLSKTFDNGMICSSEQAVIAVEAVAERVKAEFVKRGAYFMSEAEKKRLGNLLLTEKDALNPAAVGLSAKRLAELAGIDKAPSGVRLLLGECSEVGPTEKLSHEKLSPCLAFFTVRDYDEAIARSLEMVKYGGMGHTSVLYTDLTGAEKNARIDRFQRTMPTGRTLICMPSSQGAIGGIFNFRQVPSMSLCCGTWGGNATAENLGCKHLLNYKETAERREHVLWFRVPKAVFMGRGVASEVLRQIAVDGARRAFVIAEVGARNDVELILTIDVLHTSGFEVELFAEIGETAQLGVIHLAVSRMSGFQPDTIIVIGSAAAIASAKVIRLLYEHPDVQLDSLRTRFLDIQKRVVKFPPVGDKIKRLLCVPTTSGPGAEMTPFATVTDEQDGSVFSFADYTLTPDIAVIDANFVARDTKPAEVAASGWEALGNALESYVSMLASDYTKGHGLRALTLLARHLERAVAGEPQSRDACHTAAALAGMAAANAFVGISRAMATQLHSRFSIPVGACIALTMCQVVKFNAEVAPAKQGTFAQYTSPLAGDAYAEIAQGLGLCVAGDSQAIKVQRLLEWLQSLRDSLGLPQSISSCGIGEAAFTEALDDLAVGAFDDQCVSSNPRYPLLRELRELFIDAFHGRM